MIIQRSRLIARLQRVAFALSKRGIVEQSDAFIFRNGCIEVFGGDLYAKVLGLEGIDLVVPSVDIIDLLDRFPDKEVDIAQKGDELVFKGHRRAGGIMGTRDVKITSTDLPQPKKWLSLPRETLDYLTTASGVCGSEENFGSSTCVHISPDVLEATDNYRLFRWKGKTSFSDEIFLAASCIDPTNYWKVSGAGWSSGRSMQGFFQHCGFDQFSMLKRWCFFKSKRLVLGVRGIQLEKYPDLAPVCKSKGGTPIELPKQLRSMIHRAMVTAEGVGYATRVSVDLCSAKKKGKIASKCQTGWYRETFSIDYTGPDLAFEVHPKLLANIMDYSCAVVVHENRIVAKTKELTFVIALQNKA